MRHGALDVSHVVIVEVHGTRVSSGSKDGHATGALDVVLPFALLGAIKDLDAPACGHLTGLHPAREESNAPEQHQTLESFVTHDSKAA